MCMSIKCAVAVAFVACVYGKPVALPLRPMVLATGETAACQCSSERGPVLWGVAHGSAAPGPVSLWVASPSAGRLLALTLDDASALQPDKVVAVSSVGHHVILCIWLDLSESTQAPVTRRCTWTFSITSASESDPDAPRCNAKQGMAGSPPPPPHLLVVPLPHQDPLAESVLDILRVVAHSSAGVPAPGLDLDPGEASGTLPPVSAYMWDLVDIDSAITSVCRLSLALLAALEQAGLPVSAGSCFESLLVVLWRPAAHHPMPLLALTRDQGNVVSGLFPLPELPVEGYDDTAAAVGARAGSSQSHDFKLDRRQALQGDKLGTLLFGAHWQVLLQVLSGLEAPQAELEVFSVLRRPPPASTVTPQLRIRLAQNLAATGCESHRDCAGQSEAECHLQASHSDVEPEGLVTRTVDILRGRLSRSGSLGLESRFPSSSAVGHPVSFNVVWGKMLLALFPRLMTESVPLLDYLNGILKNMVTEKFVPDVDAALVASTLGSKATFLALYTPKDTVWHRFRLPFAVVASSYVMPERAWRRSFPACTPAIQMAARLAEIRRSSNPTGTPCQNGGLGSSKSENARPESPSASASGYVEDCEPGDHICAVLGMQEWIPYHTRPEVLSFTLLATSAQGPFVIWDGNHRAVAFSLHLLEALAPSPQRAELIPRECHGGGAGSAAAAHGFDFDCLVDVVVGISPTAEHHVVPNEMFCLFR